MVVLGADGCVARRYYVDVFPAAAAGPRLGAQVKREEPSAPPACASSGGVGQGPPACVSQRLALHLGSFRGRPIRSVRAYVNGKLVKAARGRNLKRLLVTVRTSGGAAIVRVDSRTRNGRGRRSVRTLRGCRRTRVRTTVLRPRR